MGTYQVPRNVKGEGRILFIFSTKALFYSLAGIVVGSLFVILFNIIGLPIVGYILMGLCGLLGFAIATFKVPNTTAFEITKKTGGENIDDVIKRAIKFKKNGGNIYIYENEKGAENNYEEKTKSKGGIF